MTTATVATLLFLMLLAFGTRPRALGSVAHSARPKDSRASTHPYAGSTLEV